MKRGTVLIADRHSPMLEGLRVLLEGRFEAVIMVADEASLFRSLDRLQPEFVVIDVSFPHGEHPSENIVSLLHRRAPDLKLIALSVHDEPVVAERALEIGASGFVVKGVAVSDLLPAIDAVLGGKKFVSPCVSRRTECYSVPQHTYDGLSIRPK